MFRCGPNDEAYEYDENINCLRKRVAALEEELKLGVSRGEQKSRKRLERSKTRFDLLMFNFLKGLLDFCLDYL